MKNIYCPLIDGGLAINLQNDKNLFSINCCCLRKESITYNTKDDIWNSVKLLELRKFNKHNQWHTSCSACQVPESAGIVSYRTGMLDTFGTIDNITGPIKLDLNFDQSCNLACRTCGPYASTYWQKHLKDNNILSTSYKIESKVDELIDILDTLDLKNLKMVTLSGGETLLGNSYWRVAEHIINAVPDAKTQLTIQFQTNGTQTIDRKYYDLLERCHLIKIHFSIDAIDEKFEYLRWPASWSQVTENMFELREKLPANVLFHLEETISIFNLWYLHELETWAKENFSLNRLGINLQGKYGNNINHGKHLAWGAYGLTNLTQPYVDSIKQTKYAELIGKEWQENPAEIKKMIEEIEKFDKIRKQDWRKTFPEVAEFYSRYIR